MQLSQSPSLETIGERLKEKNKQKHTHQNLPFKYHNVEDFIRTLTIHTPLKLLAPKQTLQRLPTALAQVKACNTSDNLPNEIRQIVYSLR